MAIAFFKFLFVNLGFLTLIFYLVIANELKTIKQNWPKYRCNPAYMFLADNISDNYRYCLSKTTEKSFGDYSVKLSGLQLSGFNDQTASTKNFSQGIKDNNKFNTGVSLSLSDLVGKSTKIGVIGTTFSAHFSSITDNLMNIVSSISSSMTSGINGLGVLNNTFSKYTAFIDKLRR